MTIKGKIQASEPVHHNNNLIGNALHKAFFRIMCGYLGGTIIGLILRRVLHG